jgi:hypothetical protein
MDSAIHMRAESGSPASSPAIAAWPPGCDANGCNSHLTGMLSGCICPQWRDSDGTHLVERNPDCKAHSVPGAGIVPVTRADRAALLREAIAGIADDSIGLLLVLRGGVSGDAERGRIDTLIGAEQDIHAAADREIR